MWLAALSLGFMSSLHCIGMCSPLAILIHGKNKSRTLVNRMLYNAGRVVTYSAMGLLVGLFGSLFHFGGIQNIFSIFAGIIILAVLCFPAVSTRHLPSWNAALIRVKSALARKLKSHFPVSSFVAGLLNGILPCGLVYMALTFAVLQSTVYESIIFMTLFGLGTIPALVAMSYGAHHIFKYMPFSVKKMQTAFLIVLAVIMIGRGIVHTTQHNQPLVDKEGVVLCP